MKTFLSACAGIMCCSFSLHAQFPFELKIDSAGSVSYASQYGNKLSCYTKVRQTFANPYPPPFKVGFYLSTDTIITTGDLLIGTVIVPCMNAFTPSCSTLYYAMEFTRPVSMANVELSGINLPNGEYYVGTYIDYENVVSESNETDNQLTFRNPGGAFKKITYPGSDVGLISDTPPEFLKMGYSAAGVYEIKSISGEKLTAQVYSIDGRLVFSGTGSEILLPLLSFEMYIITVSNGIGQVRKKVIL